MVLVPAHGTWVDGDRFWGREADLDLLTDKIDEGANLLLVAQRRMGKTSLMREAARRLNDRYVCIYVDFEKAQTAADAIVELSIALRDHKSIWKKTKEIFANIFGAIGKAIDSLKVSDLTVKLRAGLNAGNWRSKGDELFSILAASDTSVLLLIDEVPILVNRLLKGGDFKITPERRDDTDAFMSWLRNNTQKHQGKVRCVLSGSIGLEPVLRQGGLTATLNAFDPFELRPWDEATSIGCLEALAEGKEVVYQQGVPALMIAKLGCAIPHHVQIFFDRVYMHCRRRGDLTVRPEDVARVYETEMLSVRGHAELSHYEDRLKLVLSPEAVALAMEMLTEAAVAGHLSDNAYLAFQRDPSLYSLDRSAIANAQKEIMRILEHDGYLERGGKGYAFVSHLVRDWWKARNGFAYVSILKRD